jgi:RNA polymerase sigma-70 factor (ECF subfamily)
MPPFFIVKAKPAAETQSSLPPVELDALVRLESKPERNPARYNLKDLQNLEERETALTEAEAVRRAQQGEAAAFERLYQLHSQRVHSVCLRIAGNRPDADELTQETFLQLFRKISSFRGDSALSTWLHRMTVNVALMSFRRKSRIDGSLEEIRVRDKQSGRRPREFGYADPWLNGAIDRLHLQRMLDQLPPECKSMFVLRDVEGYRHQEIARILGCTVGNTKSQLHKARTMLRRLLAPNRARKRTGVANPPAGRSLDIKPRVPKKFDYRPTVPPDRLVPANSI